jgi:hypothetical protein
MKMRTNSVNSARFRPADPHRAVAPPLDEMIPLLRVPPSGRAENIRPPAGYMSKH